MLSLICGITTSTYLHHGGSQGTPSLSPSISVSGQFARKYFASPCFDCCDCVLSKLYARILTCCATIMPKFHFRRCDMKFAVAGFLVLSLVSTIVFGQTTTQRAKRGTLKICKGVPIPEGYIIVAYENSSSCPHGAYVLKKDEGSPVPQAPAAITTASRPRKVGNAIVNSIALNPPEEISNAYVGPPELKGSLSR